MVNCAEETEGVACQLSVYVAWTGTDQHHQPLMSGAQVASLNHFSASAAFADVSDQVRDTIGS